MSERDYSRLRKPLRPNSDSAGYGIAMCDTLLYLMDRLDALTQRIEAIERALTCGTGPNKLPITSPAQADVGEAPASSQPPFAVGQWAECINNDCYYIQPGERLKVCRITSNDHLQFDGKPSLYFPAWYFRPIPAPVEQGPTEGMQAVAAHACLGQGDVGKNFLLRKMVEYVGPELAARDAEITRLKADNVRLKDDCTVAVNNIGYRSEELKEARAEVERLKQPQTFVDHVWELSGNAEVERLKQQVSSLTAKLAEAEKQRDEDWNTLRNYLHQHGREGDIARPIGAMIRYADDLRSQLSAAAANVERDRDHEAMEWLRNNPSKSLTGFRWSADNKWYWCIGDSNAPAKDDPATAILAAKSAEGKG